MAILAGQRIRALDFAGYAYVADEQNPNLENTVNATITPIVGVSFMAPTSGAVELLYTFRGKSAIGGSSPRLLLGVTVNTGGVVGSGTTVFTTDDDQMVEFGGTSFGIQGASSAVVVLPGLTPGSLYNAFCIGRTTTVANTAGSNGSVFARRIAVKPWQG